MILSLMSLAFSTVKLLRQSLVPQHVELASWVSPTAESHILLSQKPFDGDCPVTHQKFQHPIISYALSSLLFLFKNYL